MRVRARVRRQRPSALCVGCANMRAQHSPLGSDPVQYRTRSHRHPLPLIVRPNKWRHNKCAVLRCDALRPSLSRLFQPSSHPDGKRLAEPDDAIVSLLCAPGLFALRDQFGVELARVWLGRARGHFAAALNLCNKLDKHSRCDLLRVVDPKIGLLLARLHPLERRR